MAEHKFPIEFNRCPRCGCELTIGKMATDKLIDEGKLKEGFYSLRKTVVPLIPPQTAKLTLPILMLHHDICVDCGCEYCVKAERQDAPIQMMKQGGSGGFGGFPPQGPYSAR